jgi:signal transduction histidine kinase
MVSLCACVLLLANTSLRGASPEKNTLLPAHITAQLDSMKGLSEQYEQAGDYEHAYREERRRLQMRDSLRSIYLSYLIDQYEETFRNEDLEMTRVRLLNQNAQMEIAQEESAREVLLLREEQDSILIENTHIQLDNAAAKELLAEKNRQLQEAEMQRKYDEQRWASLFLWALIVLILVVLGFSIYYLISGIRGNAVLRRERARARQELHRAQAAIRAQNEFMQQLNEDFQRPSQELCAASRALCEADEASSGAKFSEQEREAMMEQIRRKTAELLHRLDEVAERCSESPIKKTFCLLLLSLTTMTPAALPLRAQHNSYGISDEFYQYYKRCDRNVQDPSVLAMCDTLFAMGQKAGDKLTQCLAYNMRMGNAYFTHDIKKMREEQRRLYDFVITTPYKDYIFMGWNRLIIHYLDLNDFYQAMREAHSYQEEALRINNAYGIARGYYYIGEVYRLRGMRSEAIEQYNAAMKAQQEFGGNGRIEAAACTRIGEIYLSEGNYAAAEKYQRRTLSKLSYDFEAVNPTIELFRLYVLMGDTTRAEAEMSKLEQYRRDDRVRGPYLQKYTAGQVRYYLLKQNYDKALALAATIADRDPETMSLVQAAVGQYAEALRSLRQSVSHQEQLEASLDVSRLLSFQTEYDHMLMEKQNDLLKLQQAQIHLEQLQHDKELAVEKSRRDSIAIYNQRLQQQAIESSGKLREAELSYKLEVLKHDEQATEFQHKIQWIVSIILLTFLLFVLIALRLRRRYTMRLKRELSATESASRAAEEAIERKRNFLQQVSHEIRTPLNSIIGFNEVLSDSHLSNNLSPADRQELRQRSSAATESFDLLMNSVLELCRVASGSYSPTAERVQISEVVQRVIDTCRPRCQAGVQIIALGDADATFVTDTKGLTLILTHLLDNACKFTPSGKITVDYQLSDGRLELIVTDTGCGVPRKKADEIFNNFTKLNAFVPGIGLGLTLCRSLAKALQGTISLDTAYTSGCRFVVSLSPLSQVVEDKR